MSDRLTNNRTNQGAREDEDASLSVVSEEDQSVSGQLSESELDEINRAAEEQLAIDALEASVQRLDQVVRSAQTERLAIDALEASARRLNQVVTSAPEGRASTSQGTGTGSVLTRDMLENTNQLPQTQPRMEPIVNSTQATLNELRSLLDPIPTPSTSIADETLMADSQCSPIEPQVNPSWVESLEESRNERSPSSERER